MILRSIFLCVTFAFSSSQFAISQAASTPTCTLVLPTPFDPPTQSRVIDGELSPPLPYMVSLFRNSSFACSGSLISPNTALTSAHCLRSNTTNYKYYIKFGGKNTGEGKRYDVRSFIRHPSFVTDSSTKNDMAVLFLERPVPNATFLRVETDPSVPALWSYGRIIGFGVSNLSKRESGVLRRGDIPISPCEWAFGTLQGAACSGGYTVSNCSGCYGDSGGPWVQYDTEGTPVLIGITSRGTECGVTDSITIFTKASEVATWLKSIGVAFSRRKRPIENVFVDETPSPRPSSSPRASRSPQASRAPIASRSPNPSRAPIASRSPNPSRAPIASRSPNPSRAPIASRSPRPSRSPKPSGSPKSSGSPKPGRSPQPTRTLRPTRSPPASRRPRPSRAPSVSGVST